jgi:hypothetical protein
MKKNSLRFIGKRKRKGSGNQSRLLKSKGHVKKRFFSIKRQVLPGKKKKDTL